MKLEKKVYVDGLNLGNVSPFPGIDYYIHLSFEDSMEKASDYKKFEGRLAKLILEVEDPILDEEERKYLSDVIRPFRDEIECIIKIQILQNDKKVQCIVINFKNSDKMYFKSFKRNTMYKGMELNKEYTLKELGL